MIPKEKRKAYVKCAKELLYPKSVIEKVEKAETEDEICFIMRTARKETLK